MIKKWSYVAAAMLTVASGMALTSCIDNDEPYGIEQIRLATASLLEAKKAALSAEQAAEQARIEIDRLKAEIDKANAEKDKLVAEAEIKIKEAEAQATLLAAQAAAAKTNAEAEKLLAEADKYKADAEKTRAEAEMYIKDQQAKIDEYIAQAEIRIKKAEVEYQTALYTYEKKKADEATTANNALWTLVDQAFQAYLTAIDDLNAANKSYAESLNTLAGINADLVWVPAVVDPATGKVLTEGHFDSPKYSKKASIEHRIAVEERNIAKYQKRIDLYNDFVAQVAALNESQAAQLVEEYKGLLNQADAARHQAALEAEQVRIDQADVYNKPGEIQAEIDKLNDEEIAIDEYTVPVIDVLAAVNSAWASPIKVVEPNAEYTLPEVEAYNNYLAAVEAGQVVTPVKKDAYNAAKDEYKSLILNFTLATLDDNDMAWSEARYNEMMRQLQNDQPLKNAVAYWEAAKAAYNNGNEPDAAALPLGADLQAAIDKYNAFGATVVAAKEKLANAQEAENAAQEAYDNAMDAYQSSTDASSVPGKYYQANLAYDKAERAAQRDFSAASYAATNAYNNAVAAISLKISQLEVAVGKAIEKEIKLPSNATEQQKNDAHAAVVKAKQALALYQDGEKLDDDLIVTGYEQSGQSKDAETARDNYSDAMEAAQNAYNIAMNNAQDALNKATEEYLKNGGSTLAEKDPAYKPVADALKAYNAAQEATAVAQKELSIIQKGDLRTLRSKMVELANKQCEEITKEYDLPYAFTWRYDYAIPSLADVNDFIADRIEEFPTAVAPILLLNEDIPSVSNNWEGQVYSNARYWVESASDRAYGILGYNFDNLNPAYDWEKDRAFLLDKVDVDVINSYIQKILLKNGTAVEDITPFDYLANYSYFGLFGAQAELLIKIQFAELCKNKDANSPILAEIQVLKDNLKTLEDTYTAKSEAVEALVTEKDAADDAVTALDEQALAAVKAADEIYTIYDNILTKGYTSKDGSISVPGLEQWVTDQLNITYVDPTTGIVTELSGIEAIETVKAAYEEKIEEEASSLADAQENLAYYQYQLAQYEAGYPVEDVELYNSEYLKACVEKCEKALEFAKAHYQALQDKYDALTKQQ